MIEVRSTARFTAGGGGTLDSREYVRLLVQADVTDPECWPPDMREGATALVRVRQIECTCRAKHGTFDWEKLPEEIQDEYDTLCSLLDRLQDKGGGISWEAYKTTRPET